MTDIDADEHGVELVHDRGELHVEEISTHLGVDLTQDVRGFRRVEGAGVPVGDHLRGHPELVEHQLVLTVQVLSEQDDDDHLGVAEALATGHVLVEVVLQVLEVLFALELDPVRLLDPHV